MYMYTRRGLSFAAKMFESAELKSRTESELMSGGESNTEFFRINISHFFFNSE